MYHRSFGHMFCRVMAVMCFAFFSSMASATTVEGTHFEIDFKQLPLDFALIKLYGPDGYVSELTSSSLKSSKALPEGVYRYEVLGKVNITPKVDRYKASLNNGRSTDVVAKKKGLGIMEKGVFHIQGGKVKQLKSLQE